MEETRQKKNKCLGEAPELDMDLVYEVMVRLPIKSIIRCGAVSKSWNTVTKDQNFRKQVSRLQNKRTHILLQPTIGNVNHLNLICVDSLHLENRKNGSLALDPMLHDLKIMSSCEGMLSMASTTNLDASVIYNPLTRESLVLPSCVSRFASSSIYQQVGLGYDISTNKFKVLRAFSIQYDSRVTKKYEVLTLEEKETGTWRRLCSPKCIGHLEEYELSYCQGALYFISKPGYNFKVVRFDLKNETFCRVVCHNISRNLKHKFSSIFDDNEGSVFLAIGHERMVGFLKLGDDEVMPGELVFLVQSWNNSLSTELEWAHYNVLTQFNRDSYLVHFGYIDTSVSADLTIELVGEFRRNTLEHLICPLKLLNKPKAFAFKPSLMPLPTIASPLE